MTTYADIAQAQQMDALFPSVRAEMERWTLDVTPPGVDPVWPKSEDALLQMQGDDITHGWMQESQVMGILQEAYRILTAQSKVQPASIYACTMYGAGKAHPAQQGEVQP